MSIRAGGGKERETREREGEGILILVGLWFFHSSSFIFRKKMIVLHEPGKNGESKLETGNKGTTTGLNNCLKNTTVFDRNGQPCFIADFCKDRTAVFVFLRVKFFLFESASINQKIIG